ncbi:hypothetical protein [Blackfly microvirus SF02]|uniref:Uncharacterized protein n=1 Tax=Blackfly microvirus SF02 TaxID=2576452 RepID=A0A4P8PKK4_9VIRU|nr:hypothetical protein [Blackfly microvirus SF02]
MRQLSISQNAKKYYVTIKIESMISTISTKQSRKQYREQLQMQNKKLKKLFKRPKWTQLALPLSLINEQNSQSIYPKKTRGSKGQSPLPAER